VAGYPEGGSYHRLSLARSAACVRKQTGHAWVRPQRRARTAGTFGIENDNDLRASFTQEPLGCSGAASRLAAIQVLEAAQVRYLGVIPAARTPETRCLRMLEEFKELGAVCGVLSVRRWLPAVQPPTCSSSDPRVQVKLYTVVFVALAQRSTQKGAQGRDRDGESSWIPANFLNSVILCKSLAANKHEFLGTTG